MDLEDIQELVNSAEASTSATREEAGDMLVFGRVTQWDDEIGADVQTRFRGTFDIVKPRRNRIVSELWSNPVGVNFKPKDGADPDAAETLEGMYRTDMHRSEEAIETALQDQVDCGFGAFRLVTEYESKFDDLNNYQRIRAEPINEANNVVYLDDNSKKKDKSDMRWALVLTTFTKNGWKRYCEENGIDYEDNKEPANFKSPERTNVWFWRSDQDEIKIGEFYHRTKKRKRVLLFQDPLGNIKAYYETEIKDVLDDLVAAGFEKVGQKYKERWEVRKYLVSGEKIIKDQRVPGEYIPIIPVYGDWSYVEGREIWRGIYHDAQDQQRLHNFLMSYTADIVAQGPRQKPIFYPGQIQGYEWMYHESGADNNYPYMLQNEVSPSTNQPYPVGPVGYLETPQMPQALSNLMALMRQSVDDVTGGSMDAESMMNSQVTEGQIRAATMSQNMETFLYQNNFALAMKQCGRIYASMAAELYDVPREVTMTLPDGSERQAMVMESVMDMETGEMVTLNDITTGTFEVFASTGPNYQSQRDETRSDMADMAKQLAGTPEGQMALLKYLQLMDTPDTKDIRDWARRQLILQGYTEPETDEEKAMLQQAQMAAQNQPNPQMELARAEQLKAQADMVDAQNKQGKLQVDAYKAETDRAEALSSINKENIESAKIGMEIRGTELDNLQKFLQVWRPQGQRMQ